MVGGFGQGKNGFSWHLSKKKKKFDHAWLMRRYQFLRSLRLSSLQSFVVLLGPFWLLNELPAKWASERMDAHTIESASSLDLWGLQHRCLRLTRLWSSQRVTFLHGNEYSRAMKTVQILPAIDRGPWNTPRESTLIFKIDVVDNPRGIDAWTFFF